MPSLLHEGIIALVREKPELAAELLRELLDVSLPAFTEARLADTSLNELLPTEYRADAVVLLVDGTPVFGIILEAQLQVDPEKLFTWPMYAVSARARYGARSSCSSLRPTRLRPAGPHGRSISAQMPNGDRSSSDRMESRSLPTETLPRVSRTSPFFPSWLTVATTTCRSPLRLPLQPLQE
jgi:hypothetical protein